MEQAKTGLTGLVSRPKFNRTYCLVSRLKQNSQVWEQFETELTALQVETELTGLVSRFKQLTGLVSRLKQAERAATASSSFTCLVELL